MSKFVDFGNALYSGERSINFIGRRKLWYVIAAVMISLAVLLPILRGGFNFGIEFKGGSEYRISAVGNKPDSLAETAVASVLPAEVTHVTHVGTDSVRIQISNNDPVVSEQVRVAIADAYGVASSDVASSSIGADWGADVTGKALNGLIVFVVLAAILMALYFRTLKMSLAAVISLLHDLVITAGVYGALGFEVTPAAVIGFLTILGYSLYDTVVVFDKIRENTFEVEHSETATFAERVNLAVNQTLVRSINTSVVAVLPVASILFIGTTLLGAGTLRDIALSLFVGIVVGTYSTLFIAAPVYSHLREGEKKYKAAAKRVAAARA
jgi:preprotein translocase subunit SecF